MTAIDAVRARLQRDLSLRLIHRDTAGDVQALLDHHAELQSAFGAILGYAEHKESCGDHGAFNNAETPSCGCGLDGVQRRLDCLQAEVQVRESFNRPPVHYGFNCSGQVRPQLPPAIDLEQFRPAVERAWKASHVGSEDDLSLGKLLALIDGQPSVRSSSEHSSGVAANLVTDDAVRRLVRAMENTPGDELIEPNTRLCRRLLAAALQPAKGEEE